MAQHLARQRAGDLERAARDVLLRRGQAGLGRVEQRQQALRRSLPCVAM